MKLCLNLFKISFLNNFFQLPFCASMFPDLEQRMYTFPFDPQKTFPSSKKIVTGAERLPGNDAKKII